MTYRLTSIPPWPPLFDAEGAAVTLRGEIGSDMIDVNGHMNVLGYDILFDTAEYNLFAFFGIWEPWIAETRHSLFRLEKLIRYEAEFMQGDVFEIRSWIIASDHKRIQHFHALWNLTQNRRGAYCDALHLHVDLTARKGVAVQDPEVLARLLQMRDLAVPPKGSLQRDLPNSPRR